MRSTIAWVYNVPCACSIRDARLREQFEDGGGGVELRLRSSAQPMTQH